MLRRHLIAWAISGTSVVGTGGLTVLTVAIPAPRQPSPAPSLPPVTVYDDRYIDDVVAATPPAGPVELAAVEDPGVIPDVPPVSTPVAQSVVASAAPPTGGPPPSTPPTGSREPERPRTTSPAPNASPNPAGEPTTAPVTTAPQPTPTAPTPTTSVPAGLPPGVEVPEDWPTGTPYPPIPPGCRKPHLEDDGRWNCEH